MILRTLQLCNWRQFKDTTPKIQFSGPGGRPVTVLFGTNGAGKTAVLNAFTWTLYNSTTDGFLLPEEIVNKATIREAKPGSTLTGWVALEFENLGSLYSIKKTACVRRGTRESDVTPLGDPTTELQCCGPDGGWRTVVEVAESIGRVLPVDLHTYFFFDGERIERIVRPNKQEKADIANATKKLFGLEVLERSIRHLNAARKTLESEYASISDLETAQLLTEKTTTETTIEDCERRLEELERNIDGHNERKQELETRLRRLEDAKTVQERRDRLNQERTERIESLKDSGRELSSLVNGRGYTVFIAESCQLYKKIVEDKRAKRELPTGIKRQFVDDLLETDRCICNRSLKEGECSDARSAVEEWKCQAGLADVEEKAIRMGGEVKQLEQQLQDFWDLLYQHKKRRTANIERLSTIEGQLDSIREQLEHSPQEEVSKLEANLSKVEQAIKDDSQQIGYVKSDRKRELDRLQDINTSIRKHEENGKKQRVAQERVTAAAEAIQRIEESKSRQEEMVREYLVRKIRELFDTISYAPYVPEIAEDYSLTLRESAGGMPLRVAASQGESQILSLCFIGAIIAIAKQYQVKKEYLPSLERSVYPIVMDSPFGSLGPTYRTQITDHITNLADQVIMMVTNTQWRGEVEQSIGDRVGFQYILEYHSPKEDLARETIEIRNVTHDLIKKSLDQYEYTRVLEVPRD